MIQCIEKMVGKVKISKETLLVHNVTDMDDLEFWEDRLDKLKESYAVTYRIVKSKIVYNVYCSANKREGSLR